MSEVKNVKSIYLTSVYAYLGIASFVPIYFLNLSSGLNFLLLLCGGALFSFWYFTVKKLPLWKIPKSQRREITKHYQFNKYVFFGLFSASVLSAVLHFYLFKTNFKEVMGIGFIVFNVLLSVATIVYAHNMKES